MVNATKRPNCVTAVPHDTPEKEVFCIPQVSGTFLNVDKDHIILLSAT